MQVHPVADDQWSVLAWLWQSFKSDLAPIVRALPYSDGRYNATGLRSLAVSRQVEGGE